MEKILKILQEIRPDSDFISSTNFIQDRVLDSIDVMALVAELEETYCVKIPVTDIVPENFINIESITDMIQKNSKEKINRPNEGD